MKRILIGFLNMYIGFPTQKHWPHAPDRLLSLGYLWDDKVKDSDYIQRVAQTDPEGFQDLTGYCVPSHVDHITCRTMENALLKSVN